MVRAFCPNRPHETRPEAHRNVLPEDGDFQVCGRAQNVMTDGWMGRHRGCHDRRPGWEGIENVMIDGPDGTAQGYIGLQEAAGVGVVAEVWGGV